MVVAPVMRWLSATLMLVMAGCGGPILQDVPRPDPAQAAAVAAGAAAAATIADPDAASRKQERNTDDDGPGEVKDVTEVVPSDVLDRLDRADARAARQQP